MLRLNNKQTRQLKILEDTFPSTSVPKLSELFKTYENDSKSSRLRFGQWWLLTYMPNETNPQLFYAGSDKLAMELITNYYNDYQWEM
jgi:hypothetical protein